MAKSKIIILTGSLLALLACLWMLTGALSDRDAKWLAGIAAYFAGVILAARGMWQGKRPALWLSYGLAVSSLFLGGYICHFRWTFWLFKNPTLMDRILSVTVQNFGGILLIGFSVFWLFYFSRSEIKNQFH